MPAPGRGTRGGGSLGRGLGVRLASRRGNNGGVDRRRVSSAHFVGRAYESRALDAALASTLSGDPKILLVGGDAGVGKTRLVTEFARRARTRGARVVVGHCVHHLDRPAPFGPVVGALRELLGDLDLPARRALLTEAGPEIGVLVPDLDPRSDAPHAGGAAAPERVFDAVATTFTSVSGTAPLVLVIEDLHWSDRSTLDLLAYMARSVREEPVMIVATHRSDALHRGHPVRTAVAEMLRLDRADLLSLQPFDRDEVAEQIADILGESPARDLIDGIHARSEGNAFFAEELLAAHRDGRSSLPATLRGFLAVRFDGLTDAAIAVLRVAAVIGGSATVPLLSCGSGLGERDLHAALREAVDRALLRPDRDGSGYAFRHALLRETVLSDLLPFESVELHRRVASCIEGQPEVLIDSVHSRHATLASHWHAAGDLPRAFSHAVAAARSEVRFGAHAEASVHLALALSLWKGLSDAEVRAGTDRARLLAEAAAAAAADGEMRAAITLTSESIALLDAAADDPRAGVAHAELGRYLWWHGEPARGLQELERALDLVPDRPRSGERARVLAWYAQLLGVESRFTDAREAARGAIDHARAAGARDVLEHALTTLATSIGLLGDVDKAIPLFYEAIALALAIDASDDAARAHVNLGAVLANNGRNTEALDVYVRGAALPRIGRHWRNLLALSAGVGCLEIGDLDCAESHIAPLRSWDLDGHERVSLHQAEARIALFRGDTGGAAAALHEAARNAHSYSNAETAAQLRGQEAELARRLGRIADARAALAAGFAFIEGTDEKQFARELLLEAVRVESAAARAAVTRGDTSALADARERAHALGTGELANCGADRPYALAIVAERGRIDGRPDPDAFAAAAGAFEAVPNFLESAQLRIGEAEVALTLNDRSRASRVLTDLRRAAATGGMVLIAHEAEALAGRARIDLGGADVAPEPSIANPFGLTRRELDVLALVTEGHTNKRIAVELFVSAKTVATHVSNVLAKLGVATRGEAAAAARRLSLVQASSVPPLAGR